MYDYFKKVAWPLTGYPAAGDESESEGYKTAINELFIDFKLNLYSNHPTDTIPRVSLTAFSTTSGTLKIKIKIFYTLGGVAKQAVSDELDL